MSTVMSGAFAALVIQQVTQVVDLPSMPHRGAQHLMRFLQIGHEKPAGPPKVERGLPQKKFPVHVLSKKRVD
ncbi:MAG: hypothetical protein ABMA00_04490 [Gemmatimonas sp.]